MFNLTLAIFIILLLAVIIFLISKTKRPVQDQSILLLQQQMSQMSNQINTQLNAVLTQVNQRLQETSLVLQETNKTIGQRLDNAAQVIGKVQSSLGQLYESNKQIYEVGKDISKLSELLRTPSFRGGIGEFLLENLLTQILPRENFTLKYKFKNGEVVDAVVHLGSKMVAVDSKFPLENFKKIVEATNETEKNKYRREFIKDVKIHIDKIASAYILPDEGTFDFALMYIPAENVYYETIIKEEITSEEKSFYTYALQKKVIPVSPNSFYAYLQSIILGLRGLQIEKNAQETINYLNRLKIDFDKFKEDFRIMGGHLTNTRNKFEEAELKLERFTNKLENIGQGSALEQPAQPPSLLQRDSNGNKPI